MNFVEPVSGFLSVPDDAPPSLAHRKWPISYGSVAVVAISLDAFAILVSGIAAGAFYNWGRFGDPGAVIPYFGAAAVVAILFICVMRIQDLYNPSDLLALRTQVLSTVAAWSSVFLFLSGAAFALKIGAEFSRGAIFLFAAMGLALLLLQRLFYRALLKRGLSEQKFAGRNAVLIADEEPGGSESLLQTLLKHSFQVEHRFTMPGHDQIDAFVATVVEYIRGSNVDEIILGVTAEHWRSLDKLLAGLRILPLPVSLVPVGTAADILRRPTRVLGNSICVELHHGPLGSIERSAKRAIDFIGALSGLVLLAPLLVAAAILIKVDSSGPVLFKQRRRGFNGRQFSIFKFRTMFVLENGSVVCQATKNDDRVTRVGAFLRRTSIDELPQLFNVLVGTMSLVGPRPHAVAHDDQFSKSVRNYAFRHHVKPGLTGWAQVHGCRGPTPTVDDIQRRVQFDLWYIDNWSLRLDFAIVFRTFFEVLRARNAY